MTTTTLPIHRVAPDKIRLEASGTCQLQCPSCPTASGAIRPVIRNGFLRAESFRTLLAHNPSLREVELSNYGEVLLNPELAPVLALAHAHGVALTAHNGVNLNHARDEVLEALVRWRMQRMTVSIDGTTQAVYAHYRVGGDLARVLDNIRRINAFKQQYASEFPKLTMQFIVFGHNEHQIDEARALAESLDMTFFPKLSWDPHFSPIRNPEAVRRAVGAASRDEYREQRNGEEYLIESCHMLWDQPQVNWDGKILGCCRNHWGDFGHAAFDQPLADALNDDKLVVAREMLLGQTPPRSDVPCAHCDVYHRMQQAQRWLRREAVAERTAAG
jgi:MoaA/NifB/PqqE/SkfB family radical SAM enzyme